MWLCLGHTGNKQANSKAEREAGVRMSGCEGGEGGKRPGSWEDSGGVGGESYLQTAMNKGR